ncbi:unnamed protein product [Acanthocheilonema viteae]|uniref:Uncharacterized protein n=1 Tax=Acanthocheilonema viteae TaxID=6277 RepID=A0A498SAS3_ACAVI|nr:unnamed protein product [Acanthocheilonema viteae]
MKYFISLSIALLAGITTAQRAVPPQQSQEGQQTQQPIPELPPFLVNAPREVVNQYLDVIKGADLKSNKQIVDEIDELMHKLGGTYLTEHEKLKKLEEKEKAEYDKIHDQVVAKFSPAAKEADARMTAIFNNSTLINHVKEEQIQAIMSLHTIC